MARGPSRSSSRSSSNSHSQKPAQTQQTAKPQQQAVPQTAPQHQQPNLPMQQPSSGGMLGGIGSTIMTGMALGAGSEVGHQVVR